MPPMKGNSVTFRPRSDLRELEKALEAHLPVLEQKHAEELAAWDVACQSEFNRLKKTKSPEHPPHHGAWSDERNKKKKSP